MFINYHIKPYKSASNKYFEYNIESYLYNYKTNNLSSINNLILRKPKGH